ncbi:uncharacterized protein LOC119577620 [Penaeus monodon]|uniref:uncharacterized protein LOC119577620 n=1 Tax=Penaeus monodon TaxID=6687 RepID=UPI0018A6D3F3|nr:uncharacterized protein LOC119577620 [Penaeus monodon]
MRMQLALEDFSMNIFSVYAPQAGGTDEEKEQFWAALQVDLVKVDESERCIIGGDMNGHLGGGNDAIRRVHGGNAYGNGDEDGEKSSKTILRELSHDMEEVNTWWNDANSIILRAGKEILGESSGNKEILWFNEEVQEKVSTKKKAKKNGKKVNWMKPEQHINNVARKLRKQLPSQNQKHTTISNHGEISGKAKRAAYDLISTYRKLMTECHAKKPGEGYESEEYKKICKNDPGMLQGRDNES